MTYARDRICWDADSHLMPLPDFLSRHADPKLRGALVVGGGKNGGEKFEKWFGEIEGGRNPIRRFEESFDAAGIDEAARRRFYAGNFESMMQVGG